MSPPRSAEPAGYVVSSCSTGGEYDEPQTIPYAISSICPLGPDGERICTAVAPMAYAADNYLGGSDYNGADCAFALLLPLWRSAPDLAGRDLAIATGQGWNVSGHMRGP